MAKNVNPDQAMHQQIAQWMLAEFDKTGLSDQQVAAHQMQTHFGKQFVYRNKNLNLAIEKPILDEFKKLTPNGVWSRGWQYWRTRRAGDSPNKRMIS